MPICPYCNKQINKVNYIIQEDVNGIAQLDSYGDIELINTEHDIISQDYFCPECEATICEDDENLKEFFKGKYKWNLQYKYNITKEIIEILQDAQEKMKDKGNNDFNYGYYAHTLLKNININLDYFSEEDREIFQNPTDSQKLSIIRNILKELEYISKINHNIIFSVKKGRYYLWIIKMIKTNDLFLNLEHQKSKILHEWLNFKILNTKQQSRKKEYEILMGNEKLNLFNFDNEKEQNMAS